MKSASVVCAGIVTVDVVFSLDGALAPGLKSRAQSSYLAAGGCALNAARAVVALGGRADLSGVVGDDLFAAFLLKELDRAGIDSALLQQMPGQATARSAVLLTEDGERTIVNHRDVSLYDTGLGGAKLTGVDAVLTDTRWPRGAFEAVLAARDAGIPAVIDAEAPVRDSIRALKLASHVAFSEQGLADFAGSASAEALAQAAESLDAWVCVTRGAQSVLCHDGTALTEVPAFAVRAIDTLGAGDIWHGAFAYGLAEGRTEIEAVRRANAVAAMKTTKMGSATSLPNATELENFLKENAK